MKQGFLIVRILFFALLMVFCGFSSFGQQEEEKPTQKQLKTADETEKFLKSTNWDDPEEARKARIKLGKLFQQIDKDAGVTTNEYPVDTTLHTPIVIGAEMAEQLTNEILSDFALEDETDAVSDAFSKEITFLAMDMENPVLGFALADLKNFPNLQILYIKGTKTGTEIDLGALIDLLADKPVTDLYLVRNYAGTRTIPESIGNLTKLKKLALYGNQISSLPGSIQNLTGLEELYVDLNPIERLPEVINQLKNLKILGIAKTSINESERSRIQKLVPNCKILIK